MPNDMHPDDPRNIWQNQEVEKVTISLAELQALATCFEHRIYWRNIREYVVGAVCILFFAARLWSARGWQQLAPPLLLIPGTLYVLVQLHRRAASRPLPADVGLQASLDFHLRDLERQRDALLHIWSWYLLPLVPGFAASLAVVAASHRVKPVFILFCAVFFVAVFLAIWRLNAAAAAKLERTIQKLRGSSE